MNNIIKQMYERIFNPAKDKNVKTDIKRSHILQLVFGLVAIIFINVVGYYFFTRIDLTNEKRYSLSKPTKTFVKSLKDVIFIRCYLEGDMSANFKSLRNETREMINQFRSYNSNIEYEFFNPNKFENKQDQTDFYNRLFDLGFRPLMDMQTKSNTEVKQYIFPYIEITYGGRTQIFSLITTKGGFNEEDIISNSISNLEYNLYTALRNMANPLRTKVAFVMGHGEWDIPYIWDFAQTLGEYYSVDTVTINEKLNALTTRRYDTVPNSAPQKMINKFNTIIIAKPSKIFSYKDLYILDQFIMNGGKVLWLIDPLTASMDSLQMHAETYAISNFTGVEDPLFRYGIRLQTNLVMDRQCCKVPIKTGEYSNGQPQFTYFPWNFFPEISPNSANIITDKINPVKLEFASVIDTIENNIKKTPLLLTSEYTRLLNTPVVVSLEMLKQKQDPKLFTQAHLPVAMLLEGNFNSAFANRLAPDMENNEAIAFKDKCDSNNAMIVVGDGDIIRNDFYKGEMLPLGYDRYTRQMYGNKEFLTNCVNYLTGDENIIPLRSRQVIMRKLEIAKMEREKTFWQIINVGVPIIIILLFAFIMIFIRRRKYVHFT
ncbi:MAG: gliding motility-associated ABC transporter substrate-binding protein GldG [Bacteroidales bacterium]|jgi:gliding-associated putative ABC transporter substrate-binding component GldG|nr:gliding motility-associated ABC transporter substrate-binding protein GldG [Bacteroidales bacterium]